MRPFSRRFCCDRVEFAPAAYPGRGDAGDGSEGPTYPDPDTGTVLDAAVQRRSVQAVSPDGNVLTATRFVVLLRDDPSGLNGGLGVRKGDAFRYKGLLLVASGDATPPNGRNSLWRAECEAAS